MGLFSDITDSLGLTDSEAGLDELKESGKISAEAAKLLANIDLPDVEKMKLALENPELVGLLDAEELGDSAMDEISLDPKMREAQLKALAGLQEEVDAGGIGAEDRAVMNELRRDADARSQSEQASILDSMAQRGALDSGAQLAAQLGAQQGSAQRRAESAENEAARMAAGRKQAMMQAANMSSGMEAADFGRQAQQAQAKDIINKFNVSNRQNVAAQNLAQRQAIENQRAATANQQQMHNKALQQQNFQNKIQKAGGQATQMQNQAGQLAQTGNSMQQGAAGQLGDLVTAGAAGAKLVAASDKRVKENITPATNDLQDLLDKLNASKYNYKDGKGLPVGEQIGVMAQDLEKSNIGKEFVEESEDGTKMVDYAKTLPTQLAAIADIHERVKNLELKKEEE